MADKIAYCFIAVIFIIGAVFYWSSCTPNPNILLTKNTIQKYRSKFRKEFENRETDKLVSGLGLKISGLTFQTIRYCILIPWLLSLIYKKVYTSSNVIVPTLIWMLVFLVSSPRQKLFGQTSPFGFLLTWIQRNNRKKYNREIFRCLSQLKNLAIAKTNSRYSSDYIIAELARFTVYTKPVFDRFLGYWYESRYTEACNYFNESIGTEDAQALSSLLIKIDHLKPSEFINQLELYQNEAKERRKTSAQNSKESRSNIVFTAALVASIIILLNFLLVSIVIDTIGYFKQIQM
jgi:hypothetical protein